MLCVFVEKDGRPWCPRCKTFAPVSAGLKAKRNCKVPDCPQLGHAVDIVLIPCVGCSGRVRLKVALHACRLHGQCLPAYQGGDDYGRTCVTCPDNPANQ